MIDLWVNVAAPRHVRDGDDEVEDPHDREEGAVAGVASHAHPDADEALHEAVEGEQADPEPAASHSDDPWSHWRRTTAGGIAGSIGTRSAALPTWTPRQRAQEHRRHVA